MKAETAISGLISQVFNGNSDMLKEIFIQSQKDGLYELEKDEFEEEWGKRIKPFYEKCAAMVFYTIKSSAPELEERVVAALKDPEIVGYPDKTDFMYPSYIYLMAFYMYTGKVGKENFAKQIDKLCNEMVQHWLEDWGKELNEEE